MKATFMQRLLAYIIDIFIISLLINIFSLPFDDTKLENINKELRDAINELTAAVNGENSDLNTDEINQKVTNLEYEYQRASVFITSISVVVYIAYFIVFQFLYKGQTLGKKCLKIRVVNKEEKSFSLASMFIREIFSKGILVTFLSLITIVILEKNMYLNFYTIINMLGYMFGVICALMILYRKDRRGLHDMMAKTVVIKEEK